MTPLHRGVVTVLATGVLALMTLVDAQAQARLRGTVTDEWDNALAGARVILANADTAVTQDTMTEEDGSYQIIGLPIGNYTVEFHAEGYQAIASSLTLRVSNSRPVDVELEALPFGSRFRDDTEFEAEGGRRWSRSTGKANSSSRTPTAKAKAPTGSMR